MLSNKILLLIGGEYYAYTCLRGMLSNKILLLYYVNFEIQPCLRGMLSNKILLHALSIKSIYLV